MAKQIKATTKAGKQAKTYRQLTARWSIPKAKTLNLVLMAPRARNPFNVEKLVEDTDEDGTHRAKARYWYLQIKEPDSTEWKFLKHVIYWIPTDKREDTSPTFAGPPEDAALEAVPIIDQIVHQYGNNNPSSLEFRLFPVDIEVIEYHNACVDLNWRYPNMTIVN